MKTLVSVSYVIEFAIGLLRKGLGSLQHRNDITQVLAKIIVKTQTMWWHSKPHVAQLSCTPLSSVFLQIQFSDCAF